jgi:hypothetical protein
MLCDLRSVQGWCTVKRERLWYRHDISSAQRRALRKLRDTVSGCAYVGHLRGVRLNTLQSLHRLGLVSADTAEIQSGTVVTITDSGRLSISDDRWAEDAPASKSEAP